MKEMHMVAFTLVIVGAVNWGLSVFGLNLVEMLLGSWPTLVNLVYLLVAASGIYLAVMHMQDCRVCSDMKPASKKRR